MNPVMENGVRAYKLDTSKPLDLKSWLRTFQNKQMYFRLLPSFEDKWMMENLFYIAFAVQVGNFQVMRDKAHSLKGGAAYSGASRISEDWYYIQLYFETKEYVKMMQHYLDLLKNWAEFRIYWRKVYKKKVNKTHENAIEDDEIPLPPGYDLTKINEMEYSLSYPDDYTGMNINTFVNIHYT